MGFCSGTEIFDPVAEYVLQGIGGTQENEAQAVAVLTKLAQALEDHDWDCQNDSAFWNEPLVQRIFKQLHPDWDWSQA